MKKLIAYPATWFLYGIGSFIWNEFKSMHYSKFHVWSYKVQEWAGLENPWKDPV